MTRDPFWDALKKHSETQRRERMENNLSQAAKDDDGNWIKHTEYHWSRQHKGSRLDYWPSKKKWMHQKKYRTGDIYKYLGGATLSHTRTTKMTDLKAKSQEFIRMGEKITQGKWYYCPERLVVSIYKNNDDPIKDHEYVPSTVFDVQAMAHAPEMIFHIQALQAVINDYEARIEQLRAEEKEYRADLGHQGAYHAGLYSALSIMTGEGE